jgi:ferredoxin--NADP+ reductase
VASLLADLDGRTAEGAGISGLLAERGVEVVDLAGWRAIDAAERALGAERGRDRTTLHERQTLVAAARG